MDEHKKEEKEEKEMRKVRIAFYKAQMDSWTDFLISSWTWIWNPLTGAYSHVEIGFFEEGRWYYFSSSIRDGGTRWKKGNMILKNPEKWDVYEKKYESKTVERMVKRADSILGKKYDWLGILGFLTVTGQVLNNKNKFYCSESVWYVLTGLWKKRISPRSLSKRIVPLWDKVELNKVEQTKGESK